MDKISILGAQFNIKPFSNSQTATNKADFGYTGASFSEAMASIAKRADIVIPQGQSLISQLDFKKETFIEPEEEAKLKEEEDPFTKIREIAQILKEKFQG